MMNKVKIGLNFKVSQAELANLKEEVKQQEIFLRN